MLINSIVTELIIPVTYNPGISQKLIKLEISSCRCSKIECNEESTKIEGYPALFTPLLPLMKVKSLAECSEHSAILLTCIKRLLVLKPKVWSLLVWPFYTDLALVQYT